MNNTNANNLKVVQKLNEHFGNHREYIIIKSIERNESFGVNHYAGEVKYETTDLLKINAFDGDLHMNVLTKVLDCMRKSNDEFVHDLFSTPVPNESFSK